MLSPQYPQVKLWTCAVFGQCLSNPPAITCELEREGGCNIPKKFPWSHWKVLEPLSSSGAPVWICAEVSGTEEPSRAEPPIQQARFEASNKEISNSPRGKNEVPEFRQVIFYDRYFWRGSWSQLSFSRDFSCSVGPAFARCLCSLLPQNSWNRCGTGPTGKSSAIRRNEMGVPALCVCLHCVLLLLTYTLEAPLVSAGWKSLRARLLNHMLNLTVLLTI